MASLASLIPELFTAPSVNGAPPTRRKFSLDEIRILAEALGNPHHRFPSVLIAGTNGKGSTAATLASIARASGLKVGLYTSPHLERVNERIRLLVPHLERPGGAPGLASETWDTDIPDQRFAALYFRVHDSAQQLVLDSRLSHLPSYFELLTALAFLYFAEEQVDLAVLEVGMGGRLDATNLVDPILSVITDISLDHQEWLGPTIAAITREKAGILRPHGTLVTLPQHPEANQALGEVAVQLDVRGVPATDYMPASRNVREPHSNPAAPYTLEVLGQPILVDSPLHGAHQHRNIALAIAAAVELKTLLPALNQPGATASIPPASITPVSITPAAIPPVSITSVSIAEGIRTTHWPGRLERLSLPGLPAILLDVAHNPAGAWALRSAFSELDTSPDPQEPSPAPGAPGLAPETWDPAPPSKEGMNPSSGVPGLAPETRDPAPPSKEGMNPSSGVPGLAPETRDPAPPSKEGINPSPGAPGLAPETWDPASPSKGGLNPAPGAPGLAPETWDPASPSKEGMNPSSGAPGLAPETWDPAPPIRTCLIFACLRDKPLREMTQILFPLFDHVILAPIHSPRATDMADLLAAAEATGTPSTPAVTVNEALQFAIALNPKTIVISGSVYLVGEARHLLLHRDEAR